MARCETIAVFQQIREHTAIETQINVPPRKLGGIRRSHHALNLGLHITIRLNPFLMLPPDLVTLDQVPFRLFPGTQVFKLCREVLGWILGKGGFDEMPCLVSPSTLHRVGDGILVKVPHWYGRDGPVIPGIDRFEFKVQSMFVENDSPTGLAFDFGV